MRALWLAWAVVISLLVMFLLYEVSEVLRIIVLIHRSIGESQ